ncbi:hypothetical protein ACIP02_17305 [Pseudomonas sp. NPDC089408]|uniref:hypothetical protein n=1 Tax=Pseudomonas sp. NPDC089408 TaxID=3364465 RepID=UPI0038032651
MINLTPTQASWNATPTGSSQRPLEDTSRPTTFQETLASTAANLQGEKLTISEEAKAALQTSRSAYQDIVNNPDPEVSVQQYAVPDWMSGYGIVLDAEKIIGRTWAEIMMSANNQKFASADSGIKAEFDAGIRQHYLSVLEKNGIDTPEKHYNELIADKSRSEEIHQQFKESIASDEKLLALMQTIGISIS